MLTVASIFRNSTFYVERYLQQIRALNLNMPVRVVAVYGDCHDRTGEMLFRGLEDIPNELLRVDHGGPAFASVSDPLRWRQIASVANVALCAAVRATDPAEPFCYVESDLVWEPDDILQLVADLPHAPAVAPLSLKPDGSFYDIWGYVKDGLPFQAKLPYHPGLEEGLTKIDSAGSCFVTTGEILPHLQFSHRDCIRGIGRSLYDYGYSLWLDPEARVIHP